jgi:hypothetical protein
MAGQIVSFPASKRRAQVLQAAKMLNEVHGPAANAAWKSLMADMAEQLLATGISNGEMRQQILEFQAAVQLELRAQFEEELAQAPRA